MTANSTEVDLSGEIDAPVAEIPASKMSISLSNVSVRDWVSKRRESVQPWSEFFNFSKFKMPKSLGPASKRIMHNVDKYQSNYLFVFLGLLIFCVLTSPLLLVAMGVCAGACYMIRVRNSETPLKLAGFEVKPTHQYGAVAAMSFPLFWIAGAGGAVFWVIGASFFVIMLHASLYSLQEEQQEIDLEMEEV